MEMEKLTKKEIDKAVETLRESLPYLTAVYCTKETWQVEQAKYPERFRINEDGDLLWCGYKVGFLEDLV